MTETAAPVVRRQIVVNAPLEKAFAVFTERLGDIKQAPWYVVPSDDKKAARLNCISHLLAQFDYEDVAPTPVELPQVRDIPYVRPPMQEQTFVPPLF